MRLKATILLGIVYMFVLLRPWLPSILLSANKAYIQSELCLQREKKGNTCKGACMIKRSLERNQESGQSSNSLAYEELDLLQMSPEEALPKPLMAAVRHTAFPTLQKRSKDQHLADQPVPPPWIKGNIA